MFARAQFLSFVPCMFVPCGCVFIDEHRQPVREELSDAGKGRLRRRQERPQGKRFIICCSSTRRYDHK